jgi:hypothetical protein
VKKSQEHEPAERAADFDPFAGIKYAPETIADILCNPEKYKSVFIDITAAEKGKRGIEYYYNNSFLHGRVPVW